MAFIPAVAVYMEKSGQGTSINDVSNLNYAVSIQDTLYHIVISNTTAQHTVQMAVASGRNHFSINGNINNGNFTIGGNSHEISDEGFKYIVYADSQNMPHDPLNNHLTLSGTGAVYKGKPYSRIYGFFTSSNLAYSNHVNYNQNRSLVTGLIGGSILSGKMRGGSIAYYTDISGTFYGNRTYLANTINSLSQSSIALLGGKTQLMKITSSANNSADFELSTSVEMNLTGLNAGFSPAIRQYLGAGMITGMIPLLVAGSYQLGVARNWKPGQRMFLPLLLLVILGLLILPGTYILYIPPSLHI